MCGIIGKISRYAPVLVLREADIGRLKHRGPDDQGIYSDDYASLGHTRLSILDLSANGHQPMFSEDRRYCIVYNGEVYNYLEVKEKLKAEGVSFYTQSDTEVVLKAYIQWGKNCLGYFRGMFSFAVWDSRERLLFTARDRCGEKPFIYYMDDEYFYFASEFKALVPMLPQMPRLNPSAVDMYMHYQYTPEPFTLLEGVEKLPAAHYSMLDQKNWEYKQKEYWSLLDIQADSSITKDDIKEELHDAVKLTLRSDVEVGIALSAGIDSSGIAAIASKHYDTPMQAFCVGYPNKPRYDERDEAKKIADFLGLHFNEVELSTDTFVENFRNFALLLDEPIADIAGFGHYSVPKFCKEKGIKVLLTGIGGDEVFWGYDRIRSVIDANQQRALFETLASMINPLMSNKELYTLLFKLSRTVKIPASLREFFRKLLVFVDQDVPVGQLIYLAVTGAPEFTRHMQVGQNWYGPAMGSIGKENAYIPSQLKGPAQKEDIPITIMDLHFKTWLTSNCLSLGDRVSMAVGVETRLPLLDVRLIEKVVARRRNIPDHRYGQKALLRELLKNDLPEATIKRRKSGFIPPVKNWINGIIERYANELQKGHLVEQGILLPEAAVELAKGNHLSINQHGLYRIILLELWYSGITNLYKSSRTS